MKNSKPTIAIDMDEVLTETVKSVLTFHNNTFNNKPLSYEQITNYNLWELPGNENIDVVYAGKYFLDFFNSSVAMQAEPVEGAKEKLMSYKELGYHFVIVTGREESISSLSRTYIDTHYPNIFDEIYFCGYNTNKQIDKFTVCKQLSIKCIVEDHLENAIKYAQHGIQVFLLDRPRNQYYNPKKHKNIIKVQSWDEINFENCK